MTDLLPSARELDQPTQDVIAAAFRIQDELLNRNRWTRAERHLVACLSAWMESRLGPLPTVAGRTGETP